MTNPSRRLAEIMANLPPVYEHRRVPTEADDVLHDECGVFGVYGHPEAATLAYLGLYALQHRGQEGGGIVCSDDGVLKVQRGLGLVADIFKPHKLQRIQGTVGIGHVRYSTFGASDLKNVQPLVVDYKEGSMALAHNGNLVNGHALREELEDLGSIFQSSSDSEVIFHLISRSNGACFTDNVIEALNRITGAYSLLVMTDKEIVAARDPLGLRPLWLGQFEDTYVVASETCALDIIDAKWLREVEPGEVITINRDGLTSQKPFLPVKPKQCVFEHIYVSRPDSVIFGRSVDAFRKETGRQLARIYPVEADIVMAVPDSSNPAALGYSYESGIPFDMGFIRNHYVGRTFIEPDQGIRDFGVKIKLNPARSAVQDKRIVLVDDSIVRGTTSKKIIKMLYRCGAKEVHFRVASPPITNSCYYGIDTPNRSKLIAHNMTVEEIAKYLDVDSLAYLTIPAMLEAAGGDPEDFCLACFNSDYPTPTPDQYKQRDRCNRHVDHNTQVYGL